MKSCVIVAFLVAAFLQVEGRPAGSSTVLEDTVRQTTECGNEIGMEKMNQIPQARPNEPLPEDNSALNELMGCVWKKKGIIDDQSVVNEAKLEEYFVDLSSVFVKPGEEDLIKKIENVVHELVQECKSTRGNGYGQTAVKVQNCVGTRVQKKLAARGGVMGLTTAPTGTQAFSVIIVMLLYYFNNFF